MKRVMKEKVAVLTIAASLLVAGSTVYGGTNWSDIEYRFLPGWNGDAYSSIQTKAGVGAADLDMHDTEGYEIDVRTHGTSGSSSGVNGTWKRDVKGGNSYTINAPQAVGDNLQLHFSSNLFTTPDTLIVYQWRSN